MGEQDSIVQGRPDPTRSTPPDGEASVKDRAPGGARGRVDTILFVDDDADLVELLTLGLGERGYRVTGFTDPARAVAGFSSAPGSFDAVVSDLSMPRMSGLELARQVLEIRPGTPIVLMSGYVREEDEAAAKELGVLGFAAKGYSTEAIARELDRILRGRPSPEAPHDDGPV
jgi:CheY-like chemotaxis protein